jgi:hypothetical protein
MKETTSSDRSGSAEQFGEISWFSLVEAQFMRRSNPRAWAGSAVKTKSMKTVIHGRMGFLQAGGDAAGRPQSVGFVATTNGQSRGRSTGTSSCNPCSCSPRCRRGRARARSARSTRQLHPSQPTSGFPNTTA